MVRPALFIMGKIRDLAAKISTVTEDKLNSSLLKIVDQNKAGAIDLNLKQLFSGRDAEDQKITPVYRSKAYAEFKLSLNPAGVVDLRLTGDFYRGFFMKDDKFPLILSSNDSKKEMLEEKYGKEIFGLDQASLEEFRQEIKPDIQQLYREILSI